MLDLKKKKKIFAHMKTSSIGNKLKFVRMHTMPCAINFKQFKRKKICNVETVCESKGESLCRIVDVKSLVTV
jgi:hypothetical protein